MYCFGDAESAFWTRFFQHTSLRSAYLRNWNAQSSGIISWDFMRGIDATASKAKQYRQVLKSARDEIAALPRLLRDNYAYWSTAKYLDGLRECADQVIAKREKDIAAHETIANAFEESLPFTRRPTRNHKEVLQLWRRLRKTIVAKREDLSTSVVRAVFGKVEEATLFVFTVLFCALFGWVLGCYLHPYRDPVQIFLCVYIFKVSMDAVQEGFLFELANTILYSMIFVAKIYYTVFFISLILSGLFRKNQDLEFIEVLLLTAIVIGLYEGLNFYSRAARAIIVSIVFVMKSYFTYWLIVEILDRLCARYPHQFRIVLSLYPFDPFSKLFFHLMLVALFITVKFL